MERLALAGKNRIETVDELKKYIKLTAEEEEGIRESLKTLRMAITPYYLTLIDPENPHCPIRKQAIPTVEELKRSPADLEDPLHEAVSYTHLTLPTT